MISARLLAGCMMFAMPGFAHDIVTTNLTYSRDISRIMARRCMGCHAENASIPLTNYAEVRPWAVAMKEQVLSRKMPPWGAVKGFGDLEPDGALTQEEILIIASWALGGAPQGNPAMLPKPFPDDSKATPAKTGIEVDAKVTLPKAITIFGVAPTVRSVVSSAKIVAREPDGAAHPLVWLYEYDPNFARAYIFRKPLSLPAGTVVESSGALQFTLLTDSTRQ